jgi:hypothetical protein
MFFRPTKLVKKFEKHKVEKCGLEYVIINPYGHSVYDRKGQRVFFKTEKAAWTYAKILDENLK